MEKYNETKNISFVSKIKNSFSNILIGLCLLLISIIVLFVNEKDNVNNNKKAIFINKNVIFSSSANVDRSNDNSLIYTSGSLTTSDNTLSDGIITINDVLLLKRDVQMYQWVENVKTEKKDNVGGGSTVNTEYTYSKQWSSNYIDSSNFHIKSGHNNPKFSVNSRVVVSNNVKMGNYIVTEQQVERINKYVKFQDSLKLPTISQYRLIDGYYYNLDYNNNQPKVGDIKISYSYIPVGVNISIIGQQNSNNIISSKITKYGDIYIQQDGLLSQDEMLESFKHSNKVFTYVVRVIGFILMYVGFILSTSIINNIFSVIPFLSKFTSYISNLLFFILSLVLTLLIIAIAWFVYRPLLSLSLIVLIVTIIFSLKKIKKPLDKSNPTSYTTNQ